MMGAGPLQEMMAAMLSFARHAKSLLVCLLQMLGVSWMAALAGLAHLHVSEESEPYEDFAAHAIMQTTNASKSTGRCA